MSCLANQELLETLFEEAYEEVSKNNLFNLDEDGIRFNAECIAQQRFEDMAQKWVPTATYAGTSMRSSAKKWNTQRIAITAYKIINLIAITIGTHH